VRPVLRFKNLKQQAGLLSEGSAELLLLVLHLLIELLSVDVEYVLAQGGGGLLLLYGDGLVLEEAVEFKLQVHCSIIGICGWS
jgi:hypothetical protein